jgi:phenylpropionate dioxygenase-like ring-hydroxylating dioxygenase large terminal subunit
MNGWYLAAFRSDLAEEITPLTIGEQRLVIVRDGEDVRVFDGTCPHRGAHLGYGGVRAGACIVCPFHGKRIRLGGTTRLSVREHRVLLAGEAIFVRLSDDPVGDRGFEQAIKEIAATRSVVAAVREDVAAPAAYIVENAFDTDHFAAVHHVPRVQAMGVHLDDGGALAIDAEFRTMLSPWITPEERDAARDEAVAAGRVEMNFASRFYARAFSPAVVVTEFGPPGETHFVITGAVPVPGGCVARVAVAVRPDRSAQLPHVVRGARKALAEDVVVWNHLDVNAPQRFDARDAPVLAYRDFCASFE